LLSFGINTQGRDSQLQEPLTPDSLAAMTLKQLANGLISSISPSVFKVCQSVLRFYGNRKDGL